MTLQFIRFFNIIFASILAGVSFGIWVGLNPSGYTASTYIEQQQNLIRSLSTLMIALVVTTTVITFISAFLQRKNKSAFVTLVIAAGFLISCMVITRLGNVPIQNEMLQWTKDSLPDNWGMLRDKWWSFHIMRTVVELIALVLVTWTTVENKTSLKNISPENDHSTLEV